MNKSDYFTNNFNLSDKKNLYEILEIDHTVTKNDIKKAYKKLILKYHPDKNIQNTTEKFIKVKNAFDILYDDDKRKLYDKIIINNNNDESEIFNYVIIFLKKMINSTDINNIFQMIINKNISYENFEKMFLNINDLNFKREIVNINISLNFSLKDVWYGKSLIFNYNRITKEMFNEEIFPFDKEQIYENEGEKILFANKILNGDMIIKINITNTKIYGEQYYIYNNLLYILVKYNRIKNFKFKINFLDGYNYKFNLNKLNQIENELGKFYVKKNFGLINNFNENNKINCIDYNYTHGNLYFIILI